MVMAEKRKVFVMTSLDAIFNNNLFFIGTRLTANNHVFTLLRRWINI